MMMVVMAHTDLDLAVFAGKLFIGHHQEQDELDKGYQKKDKGPAKSR